MAGHTVKAESDFWFLRECWEVQPWRMAFSMYLLLSSGTKTRCQVLASRELPACPPGGLCVYVTTGHLIIYLPVKIGSHYMTLAALDLAS